MIVTKHLRIRGKVQGVGFRAALYREAVRLNVTGWVRNRGDGTVEAVIQGTEQCVDAISLWVGQGPRGARVDHVEVQSAEGIFPDFDLLPTFE
jgi:acylphosphatase